MLTQTDVSKEGASRAVGSEPRFPDLYIGIGQYSQGGGWNRRMFLEYSVRPCRRTALWDCSSPHPGAFQAGAKARQAYRTTLQRALGRASPHADAGPLGSDRGSAQPAGDRAVRCSPGNARQSLAIGPQRAWRTSPQMSRRPPPAPEGCAWQVAVVQRGRGWCRLGPRGPEGWCSGAGRGSGTVVALLRRILEDPVAPHRVGTLVGARLVTRRPPGLAPAQAPWPRHLAAGPRIPARGTGVPLPSDLHFLLFQFRDFPG